MIPANELEPLLSPVDDSQPWIHFINYALIYNDKSEILSKIEPLVYSPWFVLDFNHICESGLLSNITSETCSVMSIYTYELVLGKREVKPNFDNKFLEYIKTKYTKLPPPYRIVAYIYAVINDIKYLNKYKDILINRIKRTVPFVDSYELFLQYAWHGHHLMQTHLLNPDYYTNYPVNFIGDNLQVDWIHYDNDRLYINKSSYFEGIELPIYQYTIGGYQILRKHLSDLKKTNYPLDIKHFTNIINILRRTYELKIRISKINHSW